MSDSKRDKMFKDGATNKVRKMGWDKGGKRRSSFEDEDFDDDFDYRRYTGSVKDVLKEEAEENT